MRITQGGMSFDLNFFIPNASHNDLNFTHVELYNNPILHLLHHINSSYFFWSSVIGCFVLSCDWLLRRDLITDHQNTVVASREYGLALILSKGDVLVLHLNKGGVK